MKSLLRSKKGIETAPFYLIFSAFVLVLTAAIVFPAIAEWEKTMNGGKTIREAIKLRNAISEIHTMGDIGSVEVVDLNIPYGYYIKVHNHELVPRDPNNNNLLDDPVKLDTRIEHEILRGREHEGQIFSGPNGNTRIVLVYWSKKSNTIIKSPYQIWVYP